MKEEYLLTNGLGGYTSANTNFANTRKYHGILVAANPHLERFNIVNRLEEQIIVGEERHYLSTSYYSDGTIHPKGYENLDKFILEDFPIWHYKVADNIEVTRMLVIDRDANKSRIKYVVKNNSKDKISLEIAPLITYRDINQLKNYQSEHFFKQYARDYEVLIELSLGKFLKINYEKGEYQNNPDIYKDVFYPIESERGYPATEDLQRPGLFTLEIEPGEQNLELEFEFYETHTNTSQNGSDHFQEHVDYQQQLVNQFQTQTSYAPTKFDQKLIKQADQFIVNSTFSVSILAGYHWFGEWGRDTFMSLRGLLLETGRTGEAKMLLRKWNGYFKEGLLPNRPFFHEYNSLDSVLWFAVACYWYYLHTKDLETIKDVIPNLEDVIHHFENNSNNIELTPEGFLYDHNHDKALTWMDAQVNGQSVTDRSGMAVDIQALWYNFLRITQYFKQELNDQTHLTNIKSIAVKLEGNFESRFWNETKSCLFDVIRNDYTDDSLRPNQITALYLPFQLLKQRTAARILTTVEHTLLTPVGLRTLAKDDPKYIGNYGGDQATRDLAYHQGTVWPFLLGIYINALLRINKKSKKSLVKAEQIYATFAQEISKQNLSYIPEIFAADDLRPDGCISQAWSVSFFLEYLSELAGKPS